MNKASLVAPGLRFGRRLTTGEALLNDASSAAYAQVLARVKKLPGFEYLEPDFAVHATDTVPNDPQFSQQWALHNTGQSGGTAGADISAPAAWDTHTGSGDTVVAVIDTGVDYSHPDLAPNIWTNPGEIPGDGIDNDHDGFVDDVHGWNFVANNGDVKDDNLHGTHVAGTIAAVGNNNVGVVGVNWSAKIMALKFLDADGGGFTSDAVSAVNYATMMRRDYGVNIAVVNNSWGGSGFSQALLDAIKANRDAGELFVVAAGNDGANTDVNPTYPADYDVDNIISVAATDRNDKLASFSNYGVKSVDIGAPGVDILSTLPTYTTAAMQAHGLSPGYGLLSGTSMASPHVAGAAALIRDRDPGATYQEVRDALLNGGDPIGALAGKSVTSRRLNVSHSFLAPPAPLLTAFQTVLDDDNADGSSGDGNGAINPGETVGLKITVRDIATLGTTGVSATLSLASPDPLAARAYDINAAGQVVGDADLSTGARAGYIWQNGQMRQLLTSAQQVIQPSGINTDGTVVGYSNTGPKPNFNAEPWTWRDGTTAKLPTVSNEDTFARSINSAGVIAGQWDNSNDFGHALLWNGGVMTPLAGMPGFDDQVAAINDENQIVGTSRISENGAYHGFLWAAGQVTDIGVLGGGAWASAAEAINNLGVVVGNSQTAAGSATTATFWEAGEMLTLASLVPGGLPNGVTLWEATGINDRGQIVGRARTASGTDHAFLLLPLNTPPVLDTVAPLGPAGVNEPASLPCAAILAAADASDIDGNTIGFRVESVTNGSLSLNGNAVTPHSTIVTQNQTLVWQPPTDASGTVEAFRVVAWDGFAASSTSVAVDVQLARRPQIVSIVTNGRAAQRSIVNQVVVTFDQAVFQDPSAIVLARRGGGLASLTVTPSDDHMSAVLTFSGPDVVAGSLPDGIFDLSIVGQKLHAGAPAGIGMAADSTYTFFRLFADTNGDGTVNNIDAFRIKGSYLSHVGDATYNPVLDYNGDGTINNLDIFQFNKRYLQTLTP